MVGEASQMSNHNHRAQIKNGSAFIDIIIYCISGITAIVTVWPFVFIFSASVSEPAEIIKQSVWFYPKGFNLDAYKKIIVNTYLWHSYKNTVIYVVAGTLLNCFISVISAFPLTRKGLWGRKWIILYIIIPMYFTGGLIPFFILITKIGLYNNFLVMIIPGMVSIWNIILVRTFFMGVPSALQESAVIDGANDIQILFKVMIPLSMPIIAVISLYTAVYIWNSWFHALLFLPDPTLHPLQLFLAKVLIFDSSDLKSGANVDVTGTVRNMMTAMQLKYAAIMFATLPILCLYPFLQRYFVQGVFVGSLKE